MPCHDEPYLPSPGDQSYPTGDGELLKTSKQGINITRFVFRRILPMAVVLEMPVRKQGEKDEEKRKE